MRRDDEYDEYDEEEEAEYAPVTDHKSKRKGGAGHWLAHKKFEELRARQRGRQEEKRKKQGERLWQDDGDHHKKKKKEHHRADKGGDPLPFYDYAEEDEVPQRPAPVSIGAVVPAYEGLECRDSVVDFVINATDNKDECEGLRRAFDKTCSTAPATVVSPPVDGDADATAESRRRGRRVLAAYGATYKNGGHDDDGGGSGFGSYFGLGRAGGRGPSARSAAPDGYADETAADRALRRLREFYRGRVRPLWNGRPLECEDADPLPLFVEDDIVGWAWEDAVYQVRHGYDRSEEYAAAAGRLKSRSKSEKAEGGTKNRTAIAAGRRHIASVADTTQALERVHGRHAERRSNGDGDIGNDDENDSESDDAPVDVTSEETQEQVETEEDAEESSEEAQKPRPPQTQQVMLSPKLPTMTEHIDQKMLDDAVLLDQGGTNEQIVAAIEKAANITNSTDSGGDPNAAAEDAAHSAEAISKATAAVSSMLNDPDSVEARTCCASILNVFHEHCDRPVEDDLSDRRLFIIVFVIAFCGMVKSFIRHWKIRWLPEAAGCILVGVLAYCIMQFVPHFDFSFDGDMFLRVLVPPIVFEAALSINKKAFKRHIVPIMLFAFAGTLVSTALTAVIVSKGSHLFNSLGFVCPQIPFLEALLFGALISSIDPVAVLSVLGNMGMTDTDTIYVLIFGESLLNDGVAIVLFETLVHFLDDSLVIDGAAMSAATVHFIVVALGSLIVGMASGACCTAYYFAMRGVQTPLVEVLMFLCWAFIPYYICDGVGWSGIVSVVAAGFIMDLYVVGQKLNSRHDDIGEGDLQVRADDLRTLMSGGSYGGGGGERSVSSAGSAGPTLSAIFSQEGHLSAKAKTHIHFVTEINSTLMETAIFAYLGLFLFSSRYHWNLSLAFIAIMACVMSRAVMIPVFSLLSNWITRITTGPGAWTLSKLSRSRHNADVDSRPKNSRGGEDKLTSQDGVYIDRRMQVILWFAGLRGAMSFALVENIPLFDTVTKQGTRLKPELKAMTSASIVFAVFILGGTTHYLMERLGMTVGKGSPDTKEMAPLVKRNRGSTMRPGGRRVTGVQQKSSPSTTPNLSINGREGLTKMIRQRVSPNTPINGDDMSGTQSSFS